MVGVAVNVTLAPEHIEVWLATTDTVGVTLVAVIVIAFDEAGDPVAQDSLEVSRHVTTSLLAGV